MRKTAKMRHALVMEASAPGMAALATRLRDMHYRTLCAKTTEEANRIVASDDADVGAALMPPELSDAIVPDALVSLRARSRTGALEFVVVGYRPSAEETDRLRAAGVELALWDPITDAGLRFQVNRALAGAGGAWPRGSLRVPTDWKSGFEAGGRKKDGAVYSLSETGAFLTTQRPSVTGATISLNLPLPGGDLRISGRVVYANVPGNLVRPNLPMGMAVQFNDLGPDDAARLRDFVEETAANYTV
ncbi:MAG: PilZ domain-containing protein [Deltaproteobacteria bacterium]|nr:MAG: PilZ domain-containing protein [Deltaproteobacteria bacterium]